MKHVLSFFAILLFSFQTQAQKPKLLVTLDPGDRLTCLNALPYLDSVIGYDKLIVFAKKEQANAKKLSEQMLLDSYGAGIQYNDSLYHRFKMKGSQASSVTLFNSSGSVYLTQPLPRLTEKVSQINRLAKDVDTLFLDQELGSQVNFKIAPGKYYQEDLLNGLVTEMDRFSGVKQTVFALNDSIIAEGYKAKFGTRTFKIEHKKAHDYISRYKGVGQFSKLANTYVERDTLWLLLEQPYLLPNKVPFPEERDSIILMFRTLVTSVNGRAVKVQNVEDYPARPYLDYPGISKGVERLDKFDAYFPGSEFFVRDRRFFCALTSHRIYPQLRNWAWGQFALKGNSWQFEKPVAYLPDSYVREGINYNYTSFYPNNKPYVTYQFNDTFYHIYDSTKDIAMDFVDKSSKYHFKTSFNFDGHIMTLITFPHSAIEALSGDYNLHVYKYDYISKKLLAKKELNLGYMVESFHFGSTVDPFDNNYIFYSKRDDFIIRKRVF